MPFEIGHICINKSSLELNTKVSFVAILFLCYFAIFIHDPVHNDSNQSPILSYTGVTDTAEISVVSCTGFHPTNIYLDDRNYSKQISYYIQIVCVLL